MPGVGKGQVAAGRTGAGAEGATADTEATTAGLAAGLAAAFLAAGLAAAFLAAAFFAAGFFFAAAISTSLKVNEIQHNHYYTSGAPHRGITKALVTEAAEAASVNNPKPRTAHYPSDILPFAFQKNYFAYHQTAKQPLICCTCQPAKYLLLSVPRQRSARLILGDTGLKKILFFFEVDHLRHPRERIARSLIQHINTNLQTTTVSDKT